MDPSEVTAIIASASGAVSVVAMTLRYRWKLNAIERRCVAGDHDGAKILGEAMNPAMAALRGRRCNHDAVPDRGAAANTALK